MALRLFLFFLPLLLPVAGVSQENVRDEERRRLLGPVFEAGKTYRFRTDTIIQMFPQGEEPRQIKMSHQARYDASPRKGRRKGVELRGVTERLAAEIRSGGKTVTYDSWKKEDRKTDIARHFESTVSRFVTIELDERMRVVFHEEGGRSGGATPLPNLPRFGPEELVQLIQILPQGYSRGPVKQGDEWVLKGKRRVGDVGELGFEVSYKHAGMAEYEGFPCAAIEFRGQMTGDITNEDSRSIDFQGSRITGRMLFDIDRRMTRFSEQFVMMVVNTPGADGERNRPVPMRQKVTFELMQIVDQKKE